MDLQQPRPCRDQDPGHRQQHVGRQLWLRRLRAPQFGLPPLGLLATAAPTPTTSLNNLYGYVSQDPLRRVDPRGLQNILIGPNASLVVGLGIEANLGLFINPGIGESCFDIGIYGSAGAGWGLFASAGAQVGYVPGPSSNVTGVTANYNLGTGAWSGTVFTDPNFPDPVLAPKGGAVGYGISLPWGVSQTFSATGAVTVNRVLSWIGVERCGCKK